MTSEFDRTFDLQYPDDDGFDDDEFPDCPTCGGEGFVEYQDHPECWGEDCPSRVNHLTECPNCGGSGDIKDCSTF